MLDCVFGNSILLHGGCLEILAQLSPNSIDAVITDPPYGTTACKWDVVIPFGPMRAQLNRIIKPTWAIVLFGNEPFSSYLRTSNIKGYKYDWIWQKTKKSGFMNAKARPLKDAESISVFSNSRCDAAGGNSNMVYNPQGLSVINKVIKKSGCIRAGVRSAIKNETYAQSKTGYPSQILSFESEKSTVHPTQKPVPLMEYLVKTYTNEAETVLDFTMGSGTTGVACQNTNRKFIGIEKDEQYFKIASQRISGHAQAGHL